MKYFYLIILFINVNALFAQDIENQWEIFLNKSVFGDTISKKSMAKTPIKIDTAEIFDYLNLEKYSTYQLAINDSIPRFTDTVRLEIKESIIGQVNRNNKFKWKNLNPEIFLFEKGEKKKGSENFSLPIFYSKTKIIILHSWNYKENFAGLSADFWELKNGKWIKLKSETIWTN